MSWHYCNLMHWSKQNPHWMFEPIQNGGKMIERSTAFITWGIKVLHTHLRYHIENIHRSHSADISVSWKKKVWGRTALDGSPGMVTEHIAHAACVLLLQRQVLLLSTRLVSSQWWILIYMFTVLIHWWVEVFHADRTTCMCVYEPQQNPGRGWVLVKPV